MKRAPGALDARLVVKAAHHLKTLDVKESISLKHTTACFVEPCNYARTHLDAAFPDPEQLEMTDARLRQEREQLDEALQHMEHVQRLLFLLQSKEEAIPVEWQMTWMSIPAGLSAC